MDTPKGVPMAAPKNGTEVVEFLARDYHSEERHATKAKALRMVEVLGEDGAPAVKAKRYVLCDNVPKQMGITIEQTAPGRVTMGKYGEGWYPVLKGLPEDCVFASKLREALEYQASHVVLWDHDKQDHVVLTAEQAKACEAPIKSARGTGVRF